MPRVIEIKVCGSEPFMVFDSFDNSFHFYFQLKLRQGLVVDFDRDVGGLACPCLLHVVNYVAQEGLLNSALDNPSYLDGVFGDELTTNDRSTDFFRSIDNFLDTRNTLGECQVTDTSKVETEIISKSDKRKKE